MLVQALCGTVADIGCLNTQQLTPQNGAILASCKSINIGKSWNAQRHSRRAPLEVWWWWRIPWVSHASRGTWASRTPHEKWLGNEAMGDPMGEHWCSQPEGGKG